MRTQNNEVPKIFSRNPLSTFDDSLTISQYNILASHYCSSSSFPHVDDQFLQYEYRKELLTQEILQHQCDVMCFEEVDDVDFVHRIFAAKNFEINFYKSEKFEQNDDFIGNCIVWDRDKFNFQSMSSISYIEGYQNAILLKLQHKNVERDFVIAVTHLKAKPDENCEEMRKNQIYELFEELNGFVDDKKTPVVICGDFNDVQGSLVYEYVLENGYKSVYGDYEESWTTYKKREYETKRTIDYIFVKGFEVDEILEMPSEDDFPERLPAINYPSDHLLIASKLNFD